jgi:hypothetical protein
VCDSSPEKDYSKPMPQIYKRQRDNSDNSNVSGDSLYLYHNSQNLCLSTITTAETTLPTTAAAVATAEPASNQHFLSAWEITRPELFDVSNDERALQQVEVGMNQLMRDIHQLVRNIQTLRSLSNNPNLYAVCKKQTVRDMNQAERLIQTLCSVLTKSKAV